MMKNLLSNTFSAIVLTIVFLVFTSQAYAASCANSPFGVSFSGDSPPENIASTVQEITVSLGNVPSRMGDSNSAPIYELYVHSTSASNTIVETKLGESTSNSNSFLIFNLTRSQSPEVFNLNPNEDNKYAKMFVLKEKNSGNSCELWKFRTFTTPVQPTGKACGDLFTRNKCGPGNDQGGCLTGYECQSLSEGFKCVENVNKCGATTPIPQEPSQGSGGGSPSSTVLQCGDRTNNSSDQCLCFQAGSTLNKVSGDPQYCCGWSFVAACYGTQERYLAAQESVKNGVSITIPEGPVSAEVKAEEEKAAAEKAIEEKGGSLSIFKGPTSTDFADLNPLKSNDALNSPGGIVTRLLQFAFPLAGLILFVMIVWGGFEMLVGATGKGIEAGKQRVTNAILGFLALFVAYWVFQIVEVIIGVQIL